MFQVDRLSPRAIDNNSPSFAGIIAGECKGEIWVDDLYNPSLALVFSGKLVYLTKNGEGDLVVMDIQSFTRREKMLQLREELLAVEEDRLAGRLGVSPNELEKYLADTIAEVENGNRS